MNLNVMLNIKNLNSIFKISNKISHINMLKDAYQLCTENLPIFMVQKIVSLFVIYVMLSYCLVVLK